MINVIKLPVECDIRFLSAQKIPPREIHEQVCEVYGENNMSRKVWKWVCEFKVGRENVHNESRYGRPPVVSQNLVNEKI